MTHEEAIERLSRDREWMAVDLIDAEDYGANESAEEMRREIAVLDLAIAALRAEMNAHTRGEGNPAPTVRDIITHGGE